MHQTLYCFLISWWIYLYMYGFDLGYPNENHPPPKKKCCTPRSTKKGERGFIEGWYVFALFIILIFLLHFPPYICSFYVSLYINSLMKCCKWRPKSSLHKRNSAHFCVNINPSFATKKRKRKKQNSAQIFILSGAEKGFRHDQLRFCMDSVYIRINWVEYSTVHLLVILSIVFIIYITMNDHISAHFTNWKRERFMRTCQNKRERYSWALE